MATDTRVKLRDEFLINKLLRLVSFDREDRVLQIGPGDGLLFELIYKAAGECHGVEADAAIWIQLSEKLRHLPNVLIQNARATNLPFPRSYFSRVIFHNVQAHVHNELEMRRILEEIRRVSRDDAVIFIGGVPMAHELTPGGLRWQITRWFGKITRGLRKDRPRNYWWRREELPQAVFSEGRFLSLCRQYGLAGSALRTELIHSLSKSRNDFLLHPVETEEQRHALPEGGRRTLQESSDRS